MALSSLREKRFGHVAIRAAGSVNTLEIAICLPVPAIAGNFSTWPV
jgi:hypothetical protein